MLLCLSQNRSPPQVVTLSLWQSLKIVAFSALIFLHVYFNEFIFYYGFGCLRVCGLRFPNIFHDACIIVGSLLHYLISCGSKVGGMMRHLLTRLLTNNKHEFLIRIKQ